MHFFSAEFYMCTAILPTVYKDTFLNFKQILLSFFFFLSRGNFMCVVPFLGMLDFNLSIKTSFLTFKAFFKNSIS